MEQDRNNKPQHIFNASSNLLGICFLILTSLKLLSISSRTIIDEITMVAIILFMTSTFLSFLSIRNRKGMSEKLESAADIIFMGGLTLLFITALLFSFNLIS